MGDDETLAAALLGILTEISDKRRIWLRRSCRDGKAHRVMSGCCWLTRWEFRQCRAVRLLTNFRRLVCRCLYISLSATIWATDWHIGQRIGATNQPERTPPTA